MTIYEKFIEPDEKPLTIRVVEGWIGNWHISLRRRDTRREDFIERHRYNEQIGE